MFYSSQVIKNKETGEMVSYVKTVMNKDGKPYKIKVTLIDGSSKISNIDKWEEATIPKLQCCNLNCEKDATMISIDKNDCNNISYFCDEHIAEYQCEYYHNEPLYK